MKQNVSPAVAAVIVVVVILIAAVVGWKVFGKQSSSGPSADKMKEIQARSSQMGGSMGSAGHAPQRPGMGAGQPGGSQ